MKSFPENILTFIKDNKVASISFVDTDGKPYSINAFYVLDEDAQLLIFKSSPGTRHHEMIKENTSVSGTILPMELSVMKIQGIQFTGTIINQVTANSFGISAKYYVKYPVGLTIPGYMWAVKLNYLKFTDNTAGFGNKTIWQKETD